MKPPAHAILGVALPWIGWVSSGDALAHGASAPNGWTVDPWVWGCFTLLLLMRPHRTGSFLAAIAALFLALIWPLEALSDASLAAHMVQHMLLIGVAAPLLVLSRPSLRWVKALPRGGKRRVGGLLRGWGAPWAPPLAFALHAAAVWIGHAPWVMEAVVAYRWAHILAHGVLLGTAVLFWGSLRGARLGAGYAVLWTLAAMVHTGVLGALLTLSPRALYPAYSLADQQLAGLIMWVPGGLCYLAAGLASAAASLGGERRPA